MLSPYNASLRDGIAQQVAAYRAGRIDLIALQSFVSSRTNLFENDRSGIREAALRLDAHLDSARFASIDERGDAIGAADVFLAGFEDPDSPETTLR